MKKAITMIVLVLGITLTTQAQKKEKKHLTVAEKTELRVKKMTKKLELSTEQTQQITPLVREQIENRSAFKAKRKVAKENGNQPSEEQKAEMKAKRKENKIAFEGKMKTILSAEQFEEFKKMANKKRKKGKKGKKGNKNEECDKASCEKK